MKTTTNNFWALVLFTLMILLAVSCKKEPKQVINTVTYHCYSEGAKATFKYVNEANTWQELKLTGQSLDISVKMKPENMHWICTLITSGPDSISVHAECSNGKSQQKSFRSTIGTITLTVSLSDLQ